MDKDQQSPANPSPTSRSKLLWIIFAVVIVGLVLASVLPLYTSKAPDQPPAIMVPPPETSYIEKQEAPIDSQSAGQSTDSSIEAPAVSRLDSQRAAAPEPTPNIVYNPPKEMTVGEKERIEVRITSKALSEAVLAADLHGEGEVQSDHILTGKYMSVSLCCGNPSADYPFDIKALNEYKQIVGLGDYTQWAFDVTPQKKGPQELNLTVTVHQRSPGGGENSYSIPVKTENIQVKVDPVREIKTLLAEHWQWLGMLIMIPLLVIYVTRSLRNKNRKMRSGNESVFISYRRDDSSGYSLAIYEKLKLALGDDKVFMDLDDIPHGVDFSEHLEKVLSSASTVLVMIGDAWLNASNEHGRRLDNPSDFVRMEVATALDRDIRVIPVLLKNAQMPTQEALPEALQSLTKRNAIRIYDDQFEASIQRLIASLG